MTDLITGLTGSGAGATPSAGNTPQTKAVLSSDFETFIKMLTTQAEYQDPLEPLDSSEYAAQLAQFSMVEQQVLSNDLLTALSSALGGNTMGQLAGWIGMEGRTTEPALFDGSPMTVFPGAGPANAAERTLVVMDAQGREVDRQALSDTAEQVLWAGVRADGAPQPSGLYQFRIESVDSAGEPLPVRDAATYARITEVRTEGTQARVIFAGGSETAADSVTALREGA